MPLFAPSAPIDAAYITQIANGQLTAEQNLAALATGLLKNTTTTGVLSIGVSGTDYQAPGLCVLKAGDTMTGQLINEATIVIGASAPALSASDKLLIYRDDDVNNAQVTIDVLANAADTRGVFAAKRARGSLGTKAIVVSGDTLFSLVGSGYDGGAYITTARIDAFADGTVSSGVMPTRWSIQTGLTNSGSRTERMVVKSDGKVGIGNALAPLSRLHVQEADTVNNAVTNVLILEHIRTGATAGANGIGTGLLFQAETTVNNTFREQVRLTAEWVVATDASREAIGKLTAYYISTERECIRWRANTTGPMLGFYGSASVNKQTVTGSRGANAALASLLTALATLGLITDSSS